MIEGSLVEGGERCERVSGCSGIGGVGFHKQRGKWRASIKVGDVSRHLGVFDTFEVAKIESTRVYRDPIVFGRISGCDDRFYIAQYDDDVKIEDLLGPNEG